MDIQAFKLELKALLKKHDAYLGVDLDGDTHCLTTHFVLGGSGNEETILLHNSQYIDESDL